MRHFLERRKNDRYTRGLSSPRLVACIAACRMRLDSYGGGCVVLIEAPRVALFSFMDTKDLGSNCLIHSLVPYTAQSHRCVYGDRSRE